MGKKIAIGCLGVFLIVVVGGGFAGYHFLWKPMMGGFSSLQNIHQLNTQIENRQSYSVPADGELNERQVERFVAAQQQIQAGLEDRLLVLQNKYEDHAAEWEHRDPTFRELMSAWDDLIVAYTDAKEIQIQALNEHGFSLEEYRYVQGSFYQALGMEMFQYNIDKIAEAAASGNFEFNLEEFEEAQTQIEQVPERNRELVAPYANSAENWAPFAWFGL